MQKRERERERGQQQHKAMSVTGAAMPTSGTASSTARTEPPPPQRSGNSSNSNSLDGGARYLDNSLHSLDDILSEISDFEEGYIDELNETMRAVKGSLFRTASFAGLFLVILLALRSLVPTFLQVDKRISVR